jgi:UDP-glucuronate 4-epimerase
MKVLVTGNAGFIGFHTAKALLERGDEVVGFDCVNDYYDPSLKEARLKVLEQTAKSTGSAYTFIRGNLANQAQVKKCFDTHKIDRVIHLAAQAGVRYSLENPHSYVESNIVAFTNLLEACRYAQTPHLSYASTSSVYGANTKMPFSEREGVNHPLQFYAATKKANEMMAHSYSHLFRLPTTGLRFFTVYGPWGRPDMALFKFTKNTLAGEPIPVLNHGNHTRDFTYIDDTIEACVRLMDIDGYHIVNIANEAEWDIEKLAVEIKKITKSDSKIAYIDAPKKRYDYEVERRVGSSDKLKKLIGMKPDTDLTDGLKIIYDKKFKK